MSSSGLCRAPLHQCIRRGGVIMWFEHSLDGCANGDLLSRVAEQIT
jgi:hypothetical protein